VAPSAYAQAAPAGTPGYCRDDTGVTVVVDFSDLGGDIVVRCAPGPGGKGYDGLDALEGAGFTPTGTQRWGLAFVCRIEGRPAADESLHTDGNPNYHERCVDTPPSSAFWGYWYADNGGSWRYSSSGPKNRDTIAGGFEGWSFSLNHPSGSSPAPGVEPTRPAPTPPTSPSESPSPSPSSPGSSPNPGSSSPPPSHRPGHAGPNRSGPSVPPGSTSAPGASTTGPASPPSTQGSKQAHQHRNGDANGDGKGHDGGQNRNGDQPKPPSSAPTDLSTPTQNEDGVRVTGDLPSADSASDDAGSKSGTFWGLGLVAAVGLGAGVAAWRRSRRA
jgi:hypothetical protein